jgi:hypothetical protein
MKDAAIVAQYEFSGNAPFAWWFTAHNLFAAAEMIDAFRRLPAKKAERLVPGWYDVSPPSLMLRAFAVECLLKAVWLKKGARLTASGRLTPIPVKHHDLVALVQAVDALRATNRINVSAAEEKTLNRLSMYGELGRYPIARNWRVGWEYHPKAGKTVTGGWFESDYGRLDVLVKRIERIVGLTAAKDR